MGYQQDLPEMHGDPEAALGPEGRAAGNDVLSVIFGSPDVSRAVVDQAQKFSGVSSEILKKMLPVLAGVAVSGLMGGKSSHAAPQPVPATSPGAGGGLGDILGQIFGRGAPDSSGAPQSVPPQAPKASGQPAPVSPSAEEQSPPGGDLLGYILRELDNGIREGRIKPIIVEGGPIQLPMPGGQGGQNQFPAPDPEAGSPASAPSVPGGAILGQILRDMLGGAGGPARGPQEPGQPGQSTQMKDLSNLTKQLGVMDHAGSAVFGDRLEVGRDVEQDHLDNIQDAFDRFFGAQRR
jgi:hypothetical protein